MKIKNIKYGIGLFTCFTIYEYVKHIYVLAVKNLECITTKKQLKKRATQKIILDNFLWSNFVNFRIKIPIDMVYQKWLSFFNKSKVFLNI